MYMALPVYPKNYIETGQRATSSGLKEQINPPNAIIHVYTE